MQNVFDILRERGFVAQCTDESNLKAQLSKEETAFYIGFDPTSDSLHVGHLLPIMCMAWLQRAGHKPIIVLGGGTAMVGDPSGKDKTREMITLEKVEENLEGQRPLFGQFIDLDNAKLLNNADWLLRLKYVDFLRDIGKHFSVNQMIKAEGAKQRLDRNQGYSFIEFNYHLLQSFDFLHLQQNHNCLLQVGGDDQWFHFCGGVDLIRRESAVQAFAFTIPLLTTSEGKKMGKTEKGAVWIDANRLPIFDYYQYWVNVQDADVIKLMKLFTFMPLDEIEEYSKLEGANIREAKQRLALEATALAHGIEEAQKAQDAAKAVFAKGGSTSDMPTFQSEFPKDFIELLVNSEMAKSKSAARRLISGGGVKVDYGEGKESVSDIASVMKTEGVLWVGKKKCIRIIAD